MYLLNQRIVSGFGDTDNHFEVLYGAACCVIPAAYFWFTVRWPIDVCQRTQIETSSHAWFPHSQTATSLSPLQSTTVLGFASRRLDPPNHHETMMRIDSWDRSRIPYSFTVYNVSFIKSSRYPPAATSDFMKRVLFLATHTRNDPLAL